MSDDESNEISRAEAIQNFRKKCNWEIKERFRFLTDIEPILRTWNDELPNLRDLFRKEEIERLLVDSIYFLEVMIDDNPGEIFLDFVLRTGYKDEPDIGEDGKPVLHRSTPVHWAAKLDHETAAEDLFNIYDKFEANYIDEETNLTHFHAACMTGCVEIVRKFLELGQDPNLPVQKSGDAPLHLALLCGWTDVAEFLLSNGADPNLASANGSTPLHVMCQQYLDHDEAEEMLFDFCQDRYKPVTFDARDQLGNTPLHFALRYDYQKMAELLLRKGVDPNSANAKGATLLHFICFGDDNVDLIEKFFKINDELQQTVQVDARDEKGRTPLEYAVANFCPRVIEFLLDHGADLSSFVFPSESDFDEEFDERKHTILGDFKLTVASGALACVECLEKRGYQLQRSDALTIMNVFAKQNVFETPTDLDESWYDDERFARRAAKIEIRKNLTLYDFIRLRPERKENLLTFMEYFELARVDYARRIPQKPREACTAHLCEILSKRFFRRWALDPFIELMRHRLPILCCAMIIQLLMNEDLRRVCLTSAGPSSG
uniref:Uncharacterized protein n=1 Tax=Trichogramma kaykai TaxID=54128 RepID=A0ABD2WB07_9HYME